jgi:hypothetical protein
MIASDILVVDFAQKDNVLKLYPEPPLLSSDRDGTEFNFNITDINPINLLRIILTSIALSSTIAVLRLRWSRR